MSTYVSRSVLRNYMSIILGDGRGFNTLLSNLSVKVSLSKS